MLTNEAAWLEAELARLPTERLDPLLCIGSGTAHSRQVLQPWIDERVYRPLAERGVRAIHHEYAMDEGVDIGGDIADPALAERLRAAGASSVLCCNVLEHLADRASAARLIESLVPAGGYAILSVPYRFPYHPDPIDTMFRPSVGELAALFVGLEVVAGEEVRCGTLLSYLRESGSVGHSLLNGVRVAASRLRRRDAESATAAPAAPQPEHRRGGSPLPYLVRQTAVTCAILGRPAG